MAGGGAPRSRGGRRRRGSASAAGPAGWDASTPASLRPLPIILPVGYLSPPPPPTGSWAAQREPVRGRQRRPVALVKQPPGRDEDRTRLGIGDEVGFQLVEILLRSSLATPLPLRLPAAGPFPLFGGERPGARGIVGVVVPECRRGSTCPEQAGTDFGSGRRRCVATGGPARSFFRIGRFIKA